MRVRDWQDIVQDVVDADVDPDGWRAVGGDRSSGVGEDLFLGHPARGLFMLKTYAKNPYEVKGVGAKIARNLDDEIGPVLPDSNHGKGRFAVRSPPDDESTAEAQATQVEEVIKAHADAPTNPADLFDDMMEALDSPAHGPMEYDQYGRPDELGQLSSTFDEAESVLNAELDDLVSTDEVDRGFY